MQLGRVRMTVLSAPPWAGSGPPVSFLGAPWAESLWLYLAMSVFVRSLPTPDLTMSSGSGLAHSLLFPVVLSSATVSRSRCCSVPPTHTPVIQSKARFPVQ